jgi:copper transport protein
MRIRRLIAGTAAALAIVLAGAAPASAHAQLERTDPTDGNVLEAAPNQVAAQFDESVGVSPDSLRVFSPKGERVDDGSTQHGVSGSVITTNLRSNLPEGTYTVAWHVVSADSHPVAGAFTFSIITPSPTSVNAAAIATRASAAEGWLYGTARWAAYLAFALLAGTLFFLAMCWPKGARKRGVFRLIAGSWTVLVASSVAQFFLQGPYAGGLPLSRAVDPTVLKATASTRFGTTVEVRLLLLAIAVPVLAVGVQRLDGMPRIRRLRAGALILVFALGMAATWAGTGHASNGIQVPLGVLFDMLHLTAMSVWIGGLFCLAVLVLPRKDKPKQASNAVRRFSPIALASVCVLVVTGVYEAWRNVGSVAALTGSTYGHLVLYKILGIMALITFGYYARTWIAEGLAKPAAAAVTANAGAEADAEEGAEERTGKTAVAAVATAAGPTVRAHVSNGPATRRPGRRVARVGAGRKAATSEPPARTLETLRRLRWSVTSEAAVAVGVLAVTSTLVNSAPGRTLPGTATASTSVSLPFDTGNAKGTLLIVVEPGTVGENQSHMLFQDLKGFGYKPAEVDISYSLPARKLGPITSPVSYCGQGHFLDQPVTLPIAGKWVVSVTVRSDQFDETVLHIPITITTGQ